MNHHGAISKTTNTEPQNGPFHIQAVVASLPHFPPRDRDDSSRAYETYAPRRNSRSGARLPPRSRPPPLRSDVKENARDGIR